MPGQWTLSQYWVLGWVPLALLLHQPAVQAGVTEGDVPWSKTEASDPVSALASSALAEPSPQDAVEERGNPVTALGDSPETGRSSLGLATALKEEPLSEIEQPAALAGRPQQSLLNTEGGCERSQLIPSPLAVSHPKRPATRKQTRSKTPLLREFMAQEPPQADPPSAAGHWSASGHHEGRSLAAPNGRVNLPPHDDAELGLVEVQPPAADAELGIVEVQDPRLDSELGLIQLRSPLQDPELGILQLTPLALPPPPRPVLFVSAYVTASSSDNIFLVDYPLLGRIGDTFVRPGINLIAFPAIGPNTNLIASVESNFLRYTEETTSNYDELRFRAGVRHLFSNRVYGQVSVSSQLLFDEGFQEQFFTNTGIEVTLGRRDSLTAELTLDTYYQGQVFFSDPSEFSNVLNSVGAYLNYRFHPQWDTGIGYRLTISDFTQIQRHETYQRITGQLRYAITPSVRVSVFGGVSYGRSSRSDITFDDTFFGISFDATIQVF